jgi:hypothetical protein
VLLSPRDPAISWRIKKIEGRENHRPPARRDSLGTPRDGEMESMSRQSERAWRVCVLEFCARSERAQRGAKRTTKQQRTELYPGGLVKS